MITIDCRIEWGAMIPYIENPDHVPVVDCSGRIKVTGGTILNRLFYRQNAVGCGYVNETATPIVSDRWVSRPKNQVHGLELKIKGHLSTTVTVTFPWGQIKFTLGQIQKQRFIEWPYGPKYSFMAARARLNDHDPMETGYANDPIPEACPPDPVVVLKPDMFHGVRCFNRYFQRVPAWIEQTKEITAEFRLSHPSSLVMIAELMLGPPYARRTESDSKSSRDIRFELLVNGHSLGIRERFFSFFRNVQKVEEIIVPLDRRLLRNGINRLTVRNHDHCYHLLFLKASFYRRYPADTPFGRERSLPLPKPYLLGFDTNTIAPENRREFLDRVAGIRESGLGNYLLFRPEGSLIHVDDIHALIRVCRRHRIYFSYLWDEISYTRQIQDCADESFLGHMYHEPSHCFHAYASEDVVLHAHPTMQTAYDEQLHYFERLVKRVKKISPRTRVVIGEAMQLAALDYQAGVDIVMSEINMGHVGILLAEARGARHAFNKPYFGAHFAGGCLKHPAGLDVERFYDVSLYTCYLHGVNILYDEESALTMSHGKPYSFLSRFCRGRRALLARYHQFIARHGSPGKPVVPLALMAGRFENPFPRFQGSHRKVWHNFGGTGKLWDHGEPEQGWQLMDVLLPGAGMEEFKQNPETLRLWNSGTPYGQFDIITSSVSAEAMRRYRSIIFPGWNSMDEILYRKLIAFVRAGGHLFMTVPQLSTRVDREYLLDRSHPNLLFNGDVTGLFGVRIGLPAYSSGVIRPCCDDTPSGSRKSFRLSHSLKNCRLQLHGAHSVACDEHGRPVLIENRVGKGVARLLTLNAYPGSAPLKSFMRSLWETMAVETRGPVWVEDPSTDVAWYLFDNKGRAQVWLLNTDWTTAGNVKTVTIHAEGRSWPMTVPQGRPIRVPIEND